VQQVQRAIFYDFVCAGEKKKFPRCEEKKLLNKLANTESKKDSMRPQESKTLPNRALFCETPRHDKFMKHEN
jgi:hypothetical protein